MLDRTRSRRWLAGVVALGLGFGLLQFQQALRNGPLAYPPVYDNVAYLVEALSYTDVLFRDGFGALALKLAQNPPHAPLSAAMSVLGFAVLGVEDWVPNLVQILLPVALLLIVDRLGRDAGRPVRLAAMLAALSAPVTLFLVKELRPDIAWGFLLAGGISLTLSRDAARGDRRSLLSAGVLLGLAVLAKPTVLPINGVLIAGTLVILGALRVALRVPAPFARRNCLPLLVPAALIPLPHFVFAWRSVYVYVHSVVFGVDADRFLLTKPGSFWDEALFYITGPGGRAMIGTWLWAFIATAVAALILAVIRRDKTSLLIGGAGALVIMISYVVIAIPHLKSSFFGAEFSYLVVFSTIRALLYLVPTEDDFRAKATRATVAAAMAILALSSFHFSIEGGPKGMTALSEGRKWYAADESVVRILTENGVKRGSVFVSNLDRYITPATLFWLSMKDGVSANTFTEALRSSIAAEYTTKIDCADAVVDVHVAEGRGNDLPVPIVDMISNRLRSDPTMRRKGDVRVDGQPVATVYVRTPAFGGFTAVSGFGPEELQASVAPGAALSCSRGSSLSQPRQVPLHWGLGPRSVLSVEFPASGRLTIHAVGSRAGGDGSPVTVSVEGSPQGHLAFGPGRPASASLDIVGPPGPATVTFDYGTWLPPAGADPRPFAVLFDRLRFDAEP